jgi:predicted CxxxxCH...CXXCH cytochrome family protein
MTPGPKLLRLFLERTSRVGLALARPSHARPLLVTLSLGSLVTLGAALLGGCSTDRALSESPSGIHPAGWKIKGNPNFHAEYLKANKFPLSKCQTCHGTDYAGGPTQVTCSQASGCHVAKQDDGSFKPLPPSACTTCHGVNGTPRPASGAHQQHAPYCDTCHQVPTPDQIEQHASGDVSTLIHFGGVAVSGGKTPTWDRVAGRCSNTYCHGTLSPPWSDTTKIQCDSCHGAPPDSHKRWARVANGVASCVTCHPDSSAPSAPLHRNGVVDLLATVTCNTCHGSAARPSPPVSLDGSTDPTTRGVGAHARHLDPTLADRIAAPVPCDTCHQVPKTVMEPGHLDTPDTRVRFRVGGSYDPSTQSCTVWCHFNKTPGPVWTNASGSARTCNSCHAFPPLVTRAGTPHPSVAPDLAVCKVCHTFAPETHVNGVVEFTQ